MQLIADADRGVAVYAKQGSSPWAPAEPRWWQSRSCHRHFGKSEDFCSLGSESCGQNRSYSCLKALGSPLPVHPAEPELSSEMSGRGSNPWLVSFYKEIKCTDGSSILYLKGRKRILRARSGSQQTQSDSGNGGPNKAVSGQPLANSRRSGRVSQRGETSSLMCGSIPHPSKSSKQPTPPGPGRLLTAEILEEVCRVAPADPLPRAGHVAT